MVKDLIVFDFLSWLFFIRLLVDIVILFLVICWDSLWVVGMLGVDFEFGSYDSGWLIIDLFWLWLCFLVCGVVVMVGVVLVLLW